MLRRATGLQETLEGLQEHWVAVAVGLEGLQERWAAAAVVGLEGLQERWAVAAVVGLEGLQERWAAVEVLVVLLGHSQELLQAWCRVLQQAATASAVEHSLWSMLAKAAAAVASQVVL
jgi:hypothetical protein